MNRVRSLVSVLLIAVAAAIPIRAGAQDNAAGGQEITDAHLQAAWRAVQAIGADKDFNAAIPDIAEQVQTILVQRRPDLYQQIGPIVTQAASELVVRRLDLNNDVARVWALAFTEDELNQITAFYTSPVGLKLAGVIDQLQADTLQAFQDWYERLASEMLDRAILTFQQQGIAF
jgi:hypothetical protein